MSINITYSAELMTNYLPAQLIAAQKKFEAYQTSAGQALLFSIDTSGHLYATEQCSGQTRTGWTMHELSTEQTKSGATVNTFYAAQSAKNGSLSLGMSLNNSDGDTLYLSLDNSNKDTSWLSSPNWTAFAYDDASHPVSKLEIVSIFFCETTTATEYIIVDIVRNPASNSKTIHRYYIDPQKTAGQYWNSHDLAFDLSTDNYQSAVGRLPNGYVDGLYTGGNINGAAQLYFTPVINVWGNSAPTPTRLAISNGGLPDALATTRNSDQSTDLWLISGQTLYYYAANSQKNDATGVAVFSHELLDGATHMTATQDTDSITLWVRNGSDQIFYLTVANDKITDSSAWNTPVPILSQIEKFSAYINAADGGNTIFAEGDDSLYAVVKATDSGLWRTHKITLPIPTDTKPLQIKSYTTTLQVLGDNALPKAGQQISLRANTRVGVYINDVYYVLDDTPIHISSNACGTVTIIEATEGLESATFTVSSGSGTNLVISPMDTPFRKAAELGSQSGSSDALKAATITLDNGKTQPLVSSTVSSNDLKAVSLGLYHLQQRYAATQSTATGTSAVAIRRTDLLTKVGEQSFGDDILVAAGDLYRWLKSGVDAVVEVVEDAASAVWYFTAKIAGKVYRAVLNTAEEVVGAVQWLYNAIKTAIDDLIRFLEFLFDWASIKRTKEVLQNLVKQYLQAQVDGIDSLREEFDNQIAAAEKAINNWAGISDWSSLGSSASQTPSGKAKNPLAQQTSASQLLTHHLQNNASNITIKSETTLPTENTLTELIDDLIAAVEEEGGVLGEVIDELQKLATDFASLTLEEILKRLIAILVDGVLSSTQVVVDAFLKILKVIAQSVLNLLDAKIYIPVVSDILEDLGVPELSFLDLFCWVAAMAFTVVYKIAKGTEPFQDNADTRFLISAGSFATLEKAFGTTADSLVTDIESTTPSDQTKSCVFVFGHSIGGFFAMISDFFSALEAADPEPENTFSKPSMVAGILTTGTIAVTNCLVPKTPLQNETFGYISKASTGMTLLGKLVFALSEVKSSLSGKTGTLGSISFGGNARAYGAIYNATMIIPALSCTIEHFIELAKDDSSDSRDAAILEETANLSSYISRLSYTVAVNDKDEESRLVAVGIMATANLTYAGLETAEAAIGG